MKRLLRNRQFLWKAAFALPAFALVGWLAASQAGSPSAAFVNAIQESSLPQVAGATGAAWVDYDEDGWLDLFLFSRTHQGVWAFRNNGDGTFKETTEALGLRNIADVWAGVFADYDNDGCRDLYLSRPLKDLLYRNTCEGLFTNVTQEAGIEDPGYRSYGLAWADYNNDGYLDLAVANWGVHVPDKEKGYDVYEYQPNFLWRNNGNGTFTQVAEEARVAGSAEYLGVKGSAYCTNLEFLGPNGKVDDPGLPSGPYKPSLQPLWFDYDNDGFLDLFMSTDSGVSPLYRNNRDGTFIDVTQEAGFCKRGTGMGVTAGDYDNDGDLDLYVTNTGPNYFWRNNGNGTFTEVAEENGTSDLLSLGWGTGFFDYDNDGWLDLYVTNGTIFGGAQSGGWPPLVGKKKVDRLYRNNGDGTFTSVELEEGVQGDDPKEGTAFGDYNNDGFLDVAVISDGNSEPRHRLYQNNGNANSWLAVQLVGKESNRDAVGARITLVVEGRKQIREAASGASYLSQNSLRQLFGLGTASVAERMEISWPSGKNTVVENLEANRLYVIQEDEQ